MNTSRKASEPVRVAIVCGTTDVGGVSRYCVELASQFSASPDIEVRLIAPSEHSSGGWLLDQALDRHLDLHLIPMRGKFDIKAIWLMARFLKSAKIDVVHSQDYRSSIISGLAIKLCGLQTKRVSTVHALYQLALGGRSRFYVSTDLHLKKLWGDSIITVSRSIRNQLVGCGFNPSTITVVPNGVTVPSEESFSERLGSCENLQRRTLGFVGRLAAQKGIPRLVDIGRRVLTQRPEAELLVVGDGERRDLIVDLQREFGARVKWYSNEPAPHRIYPILDVLVSPSDTEGMPFVILEAMANGIPVVATSVGGVPEVITHGEDGFLFAPENVDGLTEQVLQLFTNSHLRTEIGRRARTKVQMCFSSEIMAARTRDVYRAAAGRT